MALVNLHGITPELIEDILQDYAGGMTLKAACEDRAVYYSGILNIIAADTLGAADAYKAARRARALRHAEEILDIADDSSGDFRQTARGPVFEAEAVARSKLRIDVRKTLMAQGADDLFGQRAVADIAGAHINITIDANDAALIDYRSGSTDIEPVSEQDATEARAGRTLPKNSKTA